MERNPFLSLNATESIGLRQFPSITSDAFHSNKSPKVHKLHHTTKTGNFRFHFTLSHKKMVFPSKDDPINSLYFITFSEEYVEKVHPTSESNVKGKDRGNIGVGRRPEIRAVYRPKLPRHQRNPPFDGAQSLSTSDRGTETKLINIAR